MKTASELLEQLNANIKSSVTVSVGGVEFIFNRDDAAYDELLNDLGDKNKLTPIKDYLLQIVERSQRDDLLKVIHLPNVAPQLAATVNEVFLPQIEITIKN